MSRSRLTLFVARKACERGPTRAELRPWGNPGRRHSDLVALERRPELRKIGLPTIMNWVARWLLARNFQKAAPSQEVDISKLKITGGRIELTEASMSTELRPLFSEP